MYLNIYSDIYSRRTMLGALGASLLIPDISFAQQASVGKSKYLVIEKFVEGFVRRGNLPGALVAIGRGGVGADFVGAGTIAFASEQKVNADTLWRIYSMTKPVTGIATMMLIDQGKLALDQPLSDIIPAFSRMQVQIQPDGPLGARPAKIPITIRHLLTHTAGLGYTIIQQGPIKRAYLQSGLVPLQISRLPNPLEPRHTPAPSLAAFVERLAKLPLVYEPGSRFSYSVSFDVLGRVIELVSGQRFDRYLKERIFDPLGMTSTGFTVSRNNLARLTTNYAILGGIAIPIDPGPNSIFAGNPGLLAGGAGLISSARDYDRFLAFLLGEGIYRGQRLLSQQTARLAMSNLLPATAKTKGTWVQGYGFGAGGRVSLAGAAEGEGIFGWNGAAGTIGWVDRKRQMRVTGMVQQMPMDAYPFQSMLPGIIQKQFGSTGLL